MTANSDTLYPSQKATKAYADSVVGTNASETAKGLVEEATDAEVTAGTATGATGAKLIVTPAKLLTRLTATALNPVVRTYLNAGSPATWTKPAGLKYVIVEVQAGGGAGSAGTDNGSTGTGGAGGGAGGYSRKLIAVATLGTTESVTTGAAGASSSFGAHATATAGGAASTLTGGAGGIGSSGDFNLEGGDGCGAGSAISIYVSGGGLGGSSHLGGGGKGSCAIATAGSDGNVYGGGGGGGAGADNGASSGGAGSAGIVIVTEYYI